MKEINKQKNKLKSSNENINNALIIQPSTDKINIRISSINVNGITKKGEYLNHEVLNIHHLTKQDLDDQIFIWKKEYNYI